VYERLREVGFTAPIMDELKEITETIERVADEATSGAATRR
jgi:hypothetical protein